ncbi:TetR/AcrR family transcriptional regulator [Anaerosacchariphilus polymeriproducens]|uniref:TetR/AcrR family transcriptional regulator n=1 Tax=Anaerosacchariphilus polymeriproducens TaxID=1812858 RepID=A0A371AZL7_9FIRM|nr:TetR/AcrR family transcriptional regulator [Anaerosacchariphilus polymeriproducens]RDU24920.1 TetR/AcrR family transcriptional regulator [Anaerosacchariphilus polymeriproducens]
MLEKKNEILKSARELFSEKGFKDTNISEITKKAGMATGTFYNYYSSKDKIFMDIFLEENVKLKKEIMEKINVNDNPMTVVGTMMNLNEEGMRSNPILKEWYNRDVFNRLEKIYKEEKGIDHLEFMYDSFIEVIRVWQSQGMLRKDINAEMVMAIFGALINVDTHKEEVGIQYFPKVMEYLADFILKGLMDCSKDV